MKNETDKGFIRSYGRPGGLSYDDYFRPIFSILVDMQNKNINKLDDYLNRIEAHEKAERKKKSVYLLLLVGLLAVGFTVFKFVDFGPSLRTFAVNDLDQDKIQTLFSEDESAIVVTHPDIGTDTIRSLDDYVDILNLLDLIEQNRNIALSVSDDESDVESEEDQNKLSPYMVDIAGDRRAGQSLVFNIENYDPSETYMLDYGNGYRRRVNEQSTYTYRYQGRFRIQLLATDGENGSSVYTKRIEIASAPSTSQIAESTPKKEEKKEEKKVAENNEMTDLIAENQNDDDDQEESAKEVENKEKTQPKEEVNKPKTDNLIADAGTGKEPTKVVDNSSLRSNGNTVKDLPTTPSPAKAETNKPVINTNKPLMGAQLMPEFPGGNKALARFFKRNYRYPREAQQKEVEGVVYVRFVVNPDGSLTNIKVVKGIGSGCDEEAIRLTSRMPKWIPGEQDGVKVPVYKTIPISFKLMK